MTYVYQNLHDDVKTCENGNNSKMIHWVSFNLHKYLNIHYK